MTYSAVPITGCDLKAAKRRIRAAKQAGAEMLELRTDYLEDLNTSVVRELIAAAKSETEGSLPIIVTCRAKEQGGCFEYPDEFRIEILTQALKAGAEFIDFEYEKLLSAAQLQSIRQALSQTVKGRLIVSAHEFNKKFDNINRLYHDILDLLPNAIPKLVYTARHINDCFEAFDLLHETAGQQIVFCMGRAGLISRIIAKKLGGFVTFASLDEESATAPGQVTIEQFRKLYRYDCLNAETELLGVIGSPVAHSLSPAVHNAVLDKIGANKVYLPLLVEGGKTEFDTFIDNVTARQWLGFTGFSITIPHKENAIAYVRDKGGFVEPLAEKIGAVNTLVIGADGKLRAYNTDYAGALDSITSKMGITRGDLKGMPAAVIGAGGAARAIVAGLADVGAKVKIYNRTVKRAEQLASDFGCDFAPLAQLNRVKAKLLINCTSVGMHPKTNVTPVPKEVLNEQMFVFDTVYNPAETLLLKQAKQAGAKTIDGLEMFVNQALAQFKLFTGRDTDSEVLRQIAVQALKAGVKETGCDQA